MRGVCISLLLLYYLLGFSVHADEVGFCVAYGDKRPKRLVERSSASSTTTITPSGVSSGKGEGEGEGEK